MTKRWIFLVALLLVGCTSNELEEAANISQVSEQEAAVEESTDKVKAETETSTASDKEVMSTPVTTFLDIDTLNMLAGTDQDLYDQIDAEYTGLRWEDLELTMEEFDEFLFLLSVITHGVDLEEPTRIGNRVDFTFANSDGMSGENIVYACALDYIVRHVYSQSEWGVTSEPELVFKDQDGILILALGVENP